MRTVEISESAYLAAVQRGVAGYVFGQGFRMVLPGGEIVEPAVVTVRGKCQWTGGLCNRWATEGDHLCSAHRDQAA